MRILTLDEVDPPVAEPVLKFRAWEGYRVEVEHRLSPAEIAQQNVLFIGIDPGSLETCAISVRGYHAIGDGGGGLFRYHPDTGVMEPVPLRPVDDPPFRPLFRIGDRVRFEDSPAGILADLHNGWATVNCDDGSQWRGQGCQLQVAEAHGAEIVPLRCSAPLPLGASLRAGGWTLIP